MTNIFQKVFAQAKRHSDIPSLSLENQDPNILSNDKVNQIKTQSLKIQPIKTKFSINEDKTELKVKNEKPNSKIQLRPANNNQPQNHKNQVQINTQTKPKYQRINTNHPPRSISVPKTHNDIQNMKKVKSDCSNIPRAQKNKNEDPIKKHKEETLRQLEAIEVELSNAAILLDQAEKELELEKAKHSILESKKIEYEIVKEKLLNASKTFQEKVSNEKEENQKKLQSIDEQWQFKIHELETLIECARSNLELETM